jgi:hypothetical protein
MCLSMVILKQKYESVAHLEIELKATRFDRQAEQKGGRTEAERVPRIHR